MEDYSVYAQTDEDPADEEREEVTKSSRNFPSGVYFYCCSEHLNAVAS
jgi:hypothetical protein